MAECELQGCTQISRGTGTSKHGSGQVVMTEAERQEIRRSLFARLHGRTQGTLTAHKTSDAGSGTTLTARPPVMVPSCVVKSRLPPLTSDKLLPPWASVEMWTVTGPAAVGEPTLKLTWPSRK
jgi:hypothetical protein